MEKISRVEGVEEEKSKEILTKSFKEDSSIERSEMERVLTVIQKNIKRLVLETSKTEKVKGAA
jgi:hypothetical protein